MTDPQFDEQPAMPPAPEEPAPIYWGESRPGAATTGAVLLVVFGALAILLSFVIIGQLHGAADDGEQVDGVEYGIWYGQIVFSVAQIVAGVFLWRGREWARILGLVCCWLNLIGGVIDLFSGSIVAAVFNFAINGGIIVALTRPYVREWCQEQRLAHRNG